MHVSGYAFNEPDCRGQVHVLHLLVSMVYYSMTTFTTIGFGDIYPTAWYTRFFALSEMLIAYGFTAGGFGIALNHFRKTIDEERRTVQQAYDENDPHVQAERFRKERERRLHMLSPLFKWIR